MACILFSSLRRRRVGAMPQDVIRLYELVQDALYKGYQSVRGLRSIFDGWVRGNRVTRGAGKEHVEQSYACAAYVAHKVAADAPSPGCRRRHA